MAIKPILFSTPMVQAILDGRKSMTRRVVKKKYSNTDLVMRTDKYGTRLVERQNDVPPPEPCVLPDGTPGTCMKLYAIRDVESPYRIGDILWVRETWCAAATIDSFFEGKNLYAYRADYPDTMKFPCKWRPSTYMPKAAARIFLRVTDVRVERVQDITYLDAEREGVGDMYYDAIANDGAYEKIQWNQDEGLAVHQFARLWDSINAKRGYGWDTNPWVWVYTFERVEIPGGWCAG